MTALAGPLYVVTGVLILAGVAKVLRPSPTAAALRALSIPAPMIAARSLGAAEVVIGLAAVATGRPVLWALVGVSYAGFAIFILWALNGNAGLVSCGCFGHEDTPPTIGHAAFNAAAAALAGFAIADPVRLDTFEGSAFEAVLFASLIGVGVTLSIALLTSVPRTLSLARGTAAPSVATFSLDSRLRDPLQGSS